MKSPHSNPNNCATCTHSHYHGTGHCYMYRTPPTVVCSSHTGNRMSVWKLISQMKPPSMPD